MLLKEKPYERIHMKNSTQAIIDKMTCTSGFLLKLSIIIMIRNEINHSNTGSIFPKNIGYKDNPHMTAKDSVKKNFVLLLK